MLLSEIELDVFGNVEYGTREKKQFGKLLGDLVNKLYPNESRSIYDVINEEKYKDDILLQFLSDNIDNILFGFRVLRLKYDEDKNYAERFFIYNNVKLEHLIEKLNNTKELDAINNIKSECVKILKGMISFCTEIK